MLGADDRDVQGASATKIFAAVRVRFLLLKGGRSVGRGKTPSSTERVKGAIFLIFN
jgi:hypothetical protein